MICVEQRSSAKNDIRMLQNRCLEHLRRSRVYYLGTLLTAPFAFALAILAKMTSTLNPILVFVVAVPVFCIFLILESMNDATCQVVRNELAHKIVTAALLGRGTQPTFTLYLRGEETDNRLEDQSYNAQYGRHYQKFEKGLANALQPLFPLIAVSRELSTVGAGRIHLQDSLWQTTISKLMNMAKIIILLPWSTSGIVWEMQSLVSQEFLAKTIFVMPKKNPPLITAAKWEEVQFIAEDLGLFLPEYTYLGMLFTLSLTGHLKETQYLPGLGWTQTRSAIIKLAMGLGINLGPQRPSTYI